MNKKVQFEKYYIFRNTVEKALNTPRQKDIVLAKDKNGKN